MPVRIEGAAGLAAYANQPIGSTDWEPMTFERIQAFADEISRVFVPAVICLALLTWLTWAIVAGAGALPGRD